MISDGDDNQSHITQANAEAALEKEGVAVFSLVVPSTLPWPQSAPQWSEYFLKKITRDTGGQAIMVKNLADDVAPLLSAVEGQWALSFVPAQSLGQGLHSLDIKSLEKDVRISGPAHIFVQ